MLDDTNRQLRQERSARHAVNRTVTSLQLQLDRARDEVRWQGAAPTMPWPMTFMCSCTALLRVSSSAVAACTFAGDRRAFHTSRTAASRDLRSAVRRSLGRRRTAGESAITTPACKLASCMFHGAHVMMHVLRPAARSTGAGLVAASSGVQMGWMLTSALLATSMRPDSAGAHRNAAGRVMEPTLVTSSGGPRE